MTLGRQNVCASVVPDGSREHKPHGALAIAVWPIPHHSIFCCLTVFAPAQTLFRPGVKIHSKINPAFRRRSPVRHRRADPRSVFPITLRFYAMGVENISKSFSGSTFFRSFLNFFQTAKPSNDFISQRTGSGKVWVSCFHTT